MNKLCRKVKITRNIKSKAKVLWYMKDDYPRKFTERSREGEQNKPVYVLLFVSDYTHSQGHCVKVQLRYTYGRKFNFYTALF